MKRLIRKILREEIEKSDRHYRMLDKISDHVEIPYVQQMKDKYGVTDKESQKYILKQIYGNDINFLDKNNDFGIIHNIRDTVNPNFAGKLLYIEDSTGWWRKFEYDDRGKEIYREDSNGNILDSRPQKISPSDSKETPKINTLNINDGNFSNSVVKDVVWRAGKILGQEPGGGIWFGVNKEDVENFTKQVRNEIRVGKPYKINLQNPYYFDSFWHGYLDKLGWDKNSRLNYKKKLEKQGYDGMIIGEDWWNDTGDEDAIFSKQYVVFDPKNVKPLL
jgi:hypothetical protein